MGTSDRKQTMSVVLLDEQRNEVVRWNLLRLALEYVMPDLKATNN